MENKMKLTFLSKSENESFARSAAGAFATQMNPTIDEITDIKTAVSEAVTNCVVHAYKDCIGDIVMDISIEGDIFKVEISDFGVGIKDIAKARQPFFTGGNSDERSGMGFTVMETFMDEIDVLSTVGKGTKVLMSKRIRGRQ